MGNEINSYAKRSCAMRLKIHFTIIALCVIQMMFASNAWANPIDNLKTDEDILKFYRKQLHDESFRLTNPKGKDKRMADSLGMKSWIKADLNNDGYTDILAIRDYGPERYGIAFLYVSGYAFKKYYFGESFTSNVYPVVVSLKKQTLIKLFRLKDENTFKADTLIFRVRGFFEYSTGSFNNTFDSLEYKTTFCYGSCPVFDLVIKKNGESVYNAKEYNSQNQLSPHQRNNLNFKCVIDRRHLDTLQRLLNFINFAKIKRSYAVGWTDDQACDLSITFKDGKNIKIGDYGLKGTYGLATLYRYLFDLRDNQSWTEVKK
jgi:hypothetical protein